jgi:hypothetical protein
MSEFLKHPLLLLLVGFALTGITVPVITWWWQIRQKELEIKIGLVSEVSESVMMIVMAVQRVHVTRQRYPKSPDALSASQKEMDNRYVEWEVQSSVIGTKLEAYLPHTSIPKEWTELRDVAVNDFYALEGKDKNSAQTYALDLSHKLSALLGKEVASDWVKLRGAILEMKSAIIAKILASGRLNIGGHQLSHFDSASVER